VKGGATALRVNEPSRPDAERACLAVLGLVRYQTGGDWNNAVRVRIMVEHPHHAAT
jgi:hypothetical protein